MDSIYPPADGSISTQPSEQKDDSKSNTENLNDKGNNSNTQVCSNSSITLNGSNPSNNNESWNMVQNKKRGRESPNISPLNLKQTKLDNWLGNPSMPNHNKYSSLEVDPPDIPKVIIHKPPPIFVDKVCNIQPLLTLLNENVSENYEIKVLNFDRVKIQPKIPEAYSKIVKLLEDRKTEFYTFRPKNERNFKVFLRNMHYSVNTEEIKEELKSFGHNVVNIYNIKHKSEVSYTLE